MATAVVYYSMSNNTRTGAQMVARRLDADLVELQEAHKGNVLQALLKARSRLKNDPWAHIQGADTVYLMGPIWAGHSVPAINAFVRRADFSGKQVCIVTFQASPELDGSAKVHAYLAGLVKARGGRVSRCQGLLGGNMGVFAGDQAIASQIDQLFQ